jgi:Rrf2 family protein
LHGNKKKTMFSKACEYAIKAMLYIAQQSKDGDKVGIKKIAKGINSPEPFVAKILQQLGRSELVSSAKGPNGGFYLDKKQLRYSLAAIVIVMDGDALFTGCALGLKSCSETKPCPLHNEFKAIREQMKTMLQNATVGEFNEQLDTGISFLKR